MRATRGFIWPTQYRGFSGRGVLQLVHTATKVGLVYSPSGPATQRASPRISTDAYEAVGHQHANEKTPLLHNIVFFCFFCQHWCCSSSLIVTHVVVIHGGSHSQSHTCEDGRDDPHMCRLPLTNSPPTLIHLLSGKKKRSSWAGGSQFLYLCLMQTSNCFTCLINFQDPW